MGKQGKHLPFVNAAFATTTEKPGAGFWWPVQMARARLYH